MTGVLISREETKRQKHRGRKEPCDNGVRYWSVARNKPRNPPPNYRQITEARKGKE